MAAEVGTLKLDDWLAAFTWTLDLSLLRGRKPEESIRSPAFTTLVNPDNDDTAEWHIQLYPNGVTRRARGYLSIYLHSTTQCNLLGCKSLLVYFSIGNDQNQEFEVDVPVPVGDSSVPSSRIRGIEKFVRRDLLTGASNFFFNHTNQDSKVTIKCCIKMLVGKDGQQQKPAPPPQFMKPVPRPRPTMQKAKSLDNLGLSAEEDDSDADEESDSSSSPIMDDFEAMLVHGRSDVKLLASGCSFHAHKAVLAARSTVLAEQFERDKLQKKRGTSVVDTGDLDPEVLKKVMRFVYIGKIVDLDESAHEMLGPANKYALDELKDLCEDAMIRNLNIHNACDYLVLAFSHDATRLQAHVTDFYDENCRDIMNTPGFKSMAGPNAVAIAAILAKPYLKSKLK